MPFRDRCFANVRAGGGRRCRELEALNADMEDCVRSLSTALLVREREIDSLKQDHALSFAVGRLPGHLPGRAQRASPTRMYAACPWTPIGADGNRWGRMPKLCREGRANL